MSSAVLVGIFGAAQGFRHALEPDHVTAVATVLVRDRRPMRAVAYAAGWGAGHGAVLLLLGGALIALGVKVPAPLEGVFELCVAAMLVFLGVRAIRTSRASRAQADVKPPLVKSSILIGMVHGLAGSGAVTAVAISSASTPLGSVACLALYALATMLGMAVLAGAAGPVLARTARNERVGRAIVGVAGAASVLLGVAWIIVGLGAFGRS
ncbi:MAG: hypothetical protein JST00_08145 [Deltaproteobacteria bacterium]|nr:hypothetical protein [Deltaproteobacteria bacterium]